MSTSSEEQAFITAYPRLMVENYAIFASAALLWFDFALTFKQEVQLVWKGKTPTSGATIVFLAMRYTALIERIFLCLIVISWSASDQTCGGFEHTDDVLTILNYLSIALFTVFRVRATRGKDSGWALLIVVACLALVKPALLIVESTNYVPYQGGAPVGCTNDYSFSPDIFPKFSISAKVTNIAAETIFVAVAWKKTYSSWGATMRMPLSKTVLLDGTAYYIVLLCLQIMTMITISIGSELVIWTVFPYFEQVMTVMLLSRFLFALRSIERKGPGGPQSTASEPAWRLSKIEFNDTAATTGTWPTLPVYSDPTPRIGGRLSVQPHEGIPMVDLALELTYDGERSPGSGSSSSSDGWVDGIDVVPCRDSSVEV